MSNEVTPHKWQNITPEIVAEIFRLYSRPNILQKQMIELGQEHGLTETQVRHIIKGNYRGKGMGLYAQVLPEHKEGVSKKLRNYAPRNSNPRRIQKSKSVDAPGKTQLMQKCLEAYEAYQEAKQAAIDAGADEESLRAWLQLSLDLFEG